jgi:oxygen-independent coproporphyrinogen-3 oxidase
MEKGKEFTLLFQPPASMQIAEEKKDLFLKKRISLYVHIPFCEKKCFFCSIVTCQKYTDEFIENYVRVLEKEIFDYREYFTINQVSCVHIGGGTPSLLKLEQIERIFGMLQTCLPNFKDLEIVFEGEASSLSDSKIEFLAESGQVAINIGVQTFDPGVIRKINRWSSPERIIDRLTLASKKNFRSVGIDIMCNLPFSNEDITISDIDKACDLNVNHISLYPLRVEPDSIFHDYSSKYEKAFLSLEDQMQIYSNAAKYLRGKGYEHYSIFHFSNKKEETYLYSRNQMHGGEWVGLGVAAYSYYNRSVFANTRDVTEYINLGNQGGSRMWIQEDNNIQKDLIRQFAFSLRITNIKNQYYLHKYGDVIYRKFFVPLIKYLVSEGYANEINCGFTLSDKGILNFPKIESDILDNYEKIIANHTGDKYQISELFG